MDEIVIGVTFILDSLPLQCLRPPPFVKAPSHALSRVPSSRWGVIWNIRLYSSIVVCSEIALPRSHRLGRLVPESEVQADLRRGVHGRSYVSCVEVSLQWPFRKGRTAAGLQQVLACVAN